MPPNNMQPADADVVQFHLCLQFSCNCPHCYDVIVHCRLMVKFTLMT